MPKVSQAPTLLGEIVHPDFYIWIPSIWGSPFNLFKILWTEQCLSAGHEVCRRWSRVLSVEQRSRTSPGGWGFCGMASEKLKSLLRSFHAAGSFSLGRKGCMLSAMNTCVLSVYEGPGMGPCVSVHMGEQRRTSSPWQPPPTQKAGPRPQISNQQFQVREALTIQKSAAWVLIPLVTKAVLK